MSQEVLKRRKISEKTFEDTLERYRRNDIYRIFNEVVESHKNGNQTSYRFKTDSPDPFYRDNPRVIVSHVPLILKDRLDVHLPVEAYFSMWFAPNIGLSFFTDIDFDINYRQLISISPVNSLKQQKIFDLEDQIRVDAEGLNVQALVNRVGTSDWLNLRTKHQLKGDSYIHLHPNNDRIELWEGDLNTMSNLVHQISHRIRETRRH